MGGGLMGLKEKKKGLGDTHFLQSSFVLLSGKASHDISEKLIWWVHGTYWKYIIHVTIVKRLSWKWSRMTQIEI